MTTKRRTFTIAQKSEILAFADSAGLKEAIEKYAITESQFYKWSKDAGQQMPTKKIGWIIESDDDHLVIRIPKKLAARELLSTLL